MNNQIKHFNAFSHKIWMLPSVYVLIPLCIQMRKNDLTILSLSPACRGFNFQSGIRLVSVQPHREKDSEHVNNRGVGEGLWTLQSSIWVLDLHISLEYIFFHFNISTKLCCCCFSTWFNNIHRFFFTFHINEWWFIYLLIIINLDYLQIKF